VTNLVAISDITSPNMFYIVSSFRSRGFNAFEVLIPFMRELLLLLRARKVSKAAKNST